MLVWPSELPRPSRQGWQRSLDDARVDRAASAGPALPRLLHGVRVASVSQVITIDRNQKAIFDRFLERDTMLGTLPFLMPDPTTDMWPALMPDGSPMLTSNGTPVLLAARRRCFFGKPMPVETIVGIRFRISYQLKVLL